MEKRDGMDIIKHALDSRKLLKKYRDLMVKESNTACLSGVIVRLNEEIDAQTAVIDKAIKEGRGTTKDLFLHLDYGSDSPEK
jgi:hypothetical protein